MKAAVKSSISERRKASELRTGGPGIGPRSASGPSVPQSTCLGAGDDRAGRRPAFGDTDRGGRRPQALADPRRPRSTARALPVELGGEPPAEASARFCRGIVDAVARTSSASTRSSALFEALGSAGILALEEVCGVFTICRARRPCRTASAGTSARPHARTPPPTSSRVRMAASRSPMPDGQNPY